jgi:hypothetical protein
MQNKILEVIRAGGHPDEPFFQAIEQRYGVTREELIAVIAEFGLVKARIRSYFEVAAYLNKKGLSRDEVRHTTNSVLRKKDSSNGRQDNESSQGKLF